MTQFLRTRELPYSPEQMFDLVLDVEHYPAFVPGWRRSRILERGKDSLRVEQIAGIGPLEQRFESVAHFHRPRQIEIHSSGSGPLALSVHWRFEPHGQGCRVEFCTRFREQGMLARLAAGSLDATAGPILEAFVARAGQLYGRPGSTRPPPR